MNRSYNEFINFHPIANDKTFYLAGLVSVQYCFNERDIHAAISHESSPVSLASLWDI